MSYTDKLRQKMQQKADEGSSNQQNTLEWIPPLGTTRIRLLPPIGPDFPENSKSISEDDMFYNTYKYHFFGNKESGGEYYWVNKTFTDNIGNLKQNPISTAVKSFYDFGRKTDDKELIALGGSLKMKRNYFANCIVYNDDGTFEYKILTDNTNKGKLMRVLCGFMGLPFFLDIDDNWVDKEGSQYDPDKEYYDCLSIEDGYDIKIVKTENGSNPWDITYEGSFVMKKNSRALSKEELELLDERVNLKTFKDVNNSYEDAKRKLDDHLESIGIDVDDFINDKPKKKVASVSEEAHKLEQPLKDDDAELDDILSELD